MSCDHFIFYDFAQNSHDIGKEQMRKHPLKGGCIIRNMEYYMYCAIVHCAQSCLTPCCPMYCSPPDSSAHGNFQQKYWRKVPFPSSGDLSNPGIKPICLCISFNIFHNYKFPQVYGAYFFSVLLAMNFKFQVLDFCQFLFSHIFSFLY